MKESGNLFVGIAYDELAKEPTYSSVFVHNLNGDSVVSWSSGDPVADWESFLAWEKENRGKFKGKLLTLSSLDHFAFDVPGYSWDMGEDGVEKLVADPEKAPRP